MPNRLARYGYRWRLTSRGITTEFTRVVKSYRQLRTIRKEVRIWSKLPDTTESCFTWWRE